jgi:adenylate cyclase
MGTRQTVLSPRMTRSFRVVLAEGERRLAAIMFTDIVGYTAMTQKDEASALKMLETYRGLVRPLIPKYGGREVKTMGDGSLVEFGSALEASECAVEMQKVLHNFNANAPAKILARVGIHVGDVVHSSGDIYGDAVNIASRIEPLATGGGICISGQVYYQVRNKLPYSAFRIEAGELKNVSHPTDVYRIELPWEGGSMATGTKSDRRRLAVLPLDNISPDPNDEYFADGLTDELISVLSKVKGLEVIARTSVLRYKGGAKQIAVIGEELRVGSVLEGSVRKAGNRIRVTAQLINASNQAHIWSDTYDRQLDDVFALQSDIAQKVAEALRLELSTPEALRQQPTPNLEAYTLFLRGRYAFNRLNKESLLKGIDYFESAVDLAPDFASCYAYLAQAWLLLGFFEFLPPEDAFAKAEAFASKALDLDESLAEGHVAMGRLLRMYEWKFVEADKQLKRAIELEPNLATAHAYRAQGLLALAREEEAEAEAKRALELDPLSVPTCQILGTVYLYDGRYDEAIELFVRALEIDADSPFPLGNLGLAYVQKGLLDKGIPMIEKANEIEKTNPSTKNDLAYAYAKAGRIEDVRKILAELLDMHEVSRRAAPAIAGVYTTLGEYDKAFEWLEKAFEEHAAYLGNLKHDFIYKPLRSDPRYNDLAHRIGLN